MNLYDESSGIWNHLLLQLNNTCFCQVDDLLLIEEKIDLEVRSLDTCMFDNRTFSDILNRVQKAVDDLNLHSYSNLPIWVNKLDIEVGATNQCQNYL